MTVRLELPADVEAKLLAEVRAGRHASIEEAILEKLSRNEDVELATAIGLDADEMRHDLENAWTDRSGAVDGETVFARIAARSAAAKARGK